MRDKERVHDYRFLPEPNLPCLRLYTDDTAPTCADPQVINVDAVRRAMPELPGAKRSRLASQYDIQVAQAINLVVSCYCYVLKFCIAAFKVAP